MSLLLRGDWQVGVEINPVVRQISLPDSVNRQSSQSHWNDNIKVKIPLSKYSKVAVATPGSPPTSQRPQTSPRVPLGKTGQIINQDQGEILPKKTTPSISDPKVLPLPRSSAEQHVRPLPKIYEDSLREELRNMSQELVLDLEARLLAQIQDVKSMAIQALTATKTQSIQTFQAESTEDRIKDVEANAPEVTGPQQCMKDEPESVPTIDANVIGGNARLCDDSLLMISDHVIERVNADPRICQLVNSHQSLQESFTRLLYLMEEKMPAESKQQVNNQSAKNSEVYDMVNDVQKSYKSIALEVRQLRQRCNQDVSKTVLRFEALEKRHQVIEEALILDSNERNTEADDILQPLQEDAVPEEQEARSPNSEVEADRSTMLGLASVVTETKLSGALHVLLGELLKKSDGKLPEKSDDAA